MDNKFEALVVSKDENKTFSYKVETRFVSSLKKNNILIKVLFSSINFKDSMSCLGNPAITRRFPHTPGTDAAGIVEESDNREFKKGDRVLVIGFPLGMNVSGGFGGYVYVPKEWVMKINFDLNFEEAMAYGTAGYTAALAIKKLFDHYTSFENKRFIVSGVTGGCGIFTAGILNKLNAEVVGLSRKLDAIEEFKNNYSLFNLFETNNFIESRKQNLSPQEFDGGFDYIGGKVLEAILKTIKIGGHVSTAGIVASSRLDTSLLPFILRGVTLHGINTEEDLKISNDSLWGKLCKEWKPRNFQSLYRVIDLKQLPLNMSLFIKGKIKGRIVIRHNH